MILPQRLHKAFSELTRLLERLPNGMPWDEIQTKVSAIKNMRRKDRDLFLEYCRENDRFDVIATTRKGEEASPVIRHHKFDTALTAIEQPAPLSSGRDVVFMAVPGKLTLNPQQPPVVSADHGRIAGYREATQGIVQQISKVDSMAQSMSERATVGAAVSVLNGVNIDGASPEKIMSLSQTQQLAAWGILEYLSKTPAGAARTVLGNKCVGYHRLNGTRRVEVIAALIASKLVYEQYPEETAIKRTAKVLVHRNFVKTLDVSEQRFDHDAPTVSGEVITPMVEPKTTAATPVRYCSIDWDTVQNIADDVENYVTVAGRGGMALARLHNLCPSYHKLDLEDRKRVIRFLVDAGRVMTYERGVVQYIEIVKPDVVETPTPVTPVPEIPVMEPAMEQPTPVMPQAADVLPENATAAEIRERAARMLAIAAELERRESDKTLIELVRPVCDELRQGYAEVQRALDQQIDACATLGLAVEKLNSILELK